MFIDVEKHPELNLYKIFLQISLQWKPQWKRKSHVSEDNRFETVRLLGLSFSTGRPDGDLIIEMTHYKH